MPFTLAHPVAVLITPKTQYLHKPALIIGSMSPDFIYFLAGIANSKVGHTWQGFLTVNLPLCFLIYYLYRHFIAPYFWQSLPRLLSFQLQPYPSPHTSLKNVSVFILSCYIGMGSHLLLDAFTHKTSTVVRHSDWLQMMVSIGSLPHLPIYKWLQYTGGILGLAAIGLYLLVMAYRYPSNYQTPVTDKVKYWISVIGIALVTLFLWSVIEPIKQQGHVWLVISIIRLVDVGFFGLVMLGILKKLAHKNSVIT